MPKGINSIKSHIGKKYNKLLVLDGYHKLVSSGKNRGFLKCQCDCGQIKEFDSNSVITGNSLSCGCFKRDIGLIPKGTVITWLTVGDRFVKNGRNYYKCMCKCGTECEYQQGSLRSKRAVSCGCKKRKSPTEDAWGFYIREYARGAKDRGLEWNLTLEQVQEIAIKNCTYCNAPPAKRETAARHYVRAFKGRETYNKDFRDSKIINVNGLDRIDSSKGYEVGNVNPCCRTCNRGKSDLGLSEWIQYLDALAEYRISLK